MTPGTSYAELLNALLEAERAGAKLLAAWVDELPPGCAAWRRLREVQRDEASNCAVLIHLLLQAGIEPTTATGEFYRKGLAIRSWRERIDYLNRGQAWVARRIAAALPGIDAPEGERLLRAMHESHLANRVDIDALFETPQPLASSNAA